MKHHPIKASIIIATLLSLGFGATAPGQSVLWQLDVVGPATPPNVAVTTAPNIDTVASTDGPGYAASGVGLTAFDTSPEGTVRHAAGGVLTVTEFDNRHSQFTIAAAPGFVLSPTSLTFNSARGGPAGTRGFEIYAGVDGLPTSADLVLKVEDEPGTRAAPTERSVDLTGAEFQGATSLTFRYFPLTAAGGSSIDFTAMTLNGEVIPLDEPFASTGGPYTVQLGGFLELDASGSLPAFGETITSIEWDLNNNGDFSDASGAMPAPIGTPDLESLWGMSVGENTIQVRVTDSSAQSATAATTVTLVPVTVPIANFGFEQPVLPSGQIAPGAPGWTAFNDGLINVLHPVANDFDALAPEGNNVGLVTSTFGEESGFSQVLSGTTGQLQVDASYTLEVEVGNSNATPGFPGYRVQLLAGGTVLAEDDNSLTVPEGEFVTTTLNYGFNAGEHAALAGEPLEIRLLSKGLVAAVELGFDNVRLSPSFSAPVAAPGGPYFVTASGGGLSLDGSGSLPADGETITLYEWDLNNNNTFGDVTGAMPAEISVDDLQNVWGMTEGDNTIQLRVTDSAANTATATTVVTIVDFTELTQSGAWLTGEWTFGVPSGDIDAVIAEGVTASSTNSVTPWNGTLTMRENSVLNMTVPTAATTPPDIPIDGATTIIMHDGSRILDGYSNHTLDADFVISGEAGMAPSAGTTGWNRNRIFTGVISGDGTWTTNGRNHMGYTYNNTNTYTGGYLIRSSDRHGIGFNAPGAAGAGDVTVFPREDGRSGVIILGADNVFAPTAVLTLNGRGWNDSTGGFGPYASGPHVGNQVRISMNAFNATVAELWIDDVRMPDGQYTGTSGDWIAGTGILTVGEFVPADPYGAWAAGFAGLTNPDPNLDFDGGGLATGIEWVVGGDPTNPADDSALAPVIDATSDPDGKLLFTFRRTAGAANDPNTSIAVEYSVGLLDWTAATHQGTGPNDITITEVPDGFGPGVDQVTVALPASLTDVDRLFARLRAIVTIP